VLTRYRLTELLGQGGMGAVWAACHVVTGKEVALKLITGSLANSAELRQRFQREARAASAVEHPNVVAVHDVFEMDDGAPVMVLERLRGETLADLLKRDGELTLGRTASIFLPVISAVGTAHASGVVHRDLKPSNIFIARQHGGEQIKVVDFGIAKLTAFEGDADTATTTGTLLGTPQYMPPEQIFGEKDIDHRADVWALGVNLSSV
jgi:serine/threonine protein kinase